MRPLILGLASLALVLPAIAGGAPAYDGTACRAPATTWANDPCAGRQWGLTAIRAPQAWRTTRGANVVVAVIDTGVDLNHPDLQGRLVLRPGSNLLRNTVSRCSFQRPVPRPRSSPHLARDDNGHGTHVAGIVAAAAGNKRGVAGVAPGAPLLPVKGLHPTRAGTHPAVA